MPHLLARSTLARATAMVAVASLTIGPRHAAAQGATTAATIPGTTYTLHGATVPRGTDIEGISPMASLRSNYTAVVVFAAGRGRMDITDGKTTTFEKGDFVLFDSADYIVVHPKGKIFYGAPKNLFADMSSMAEASGVRASLNGVKVSLDTLGTKDQVSGLATQHYRITSNYTMVFDLSAIDPSVPSVRLDSKLTQEIWYADVPNFPPMPFGQVSSTMLADLSEMMNGSLRELATKLAAVQSGLPVGKVAVKGTQAMRFGGSGYDMTTEISGIKDAPVDVTQMVLPDGFTETLMPGLEALGASKTLSADGGAKWKIKPGGGY